MVSKPKYHTQKLFSKNLLAIEIREKQRYLVYLGLSISELNKIVMYEFWNDCVKWKYGKKAKLCYMETDSFFVYIKTDDICKEIAEDVETRFETSNYELDRPLPKGKNKKVIGLMKDELCGKIMKAFLDLKAKVT